MKAFSLWDLLGPVLLIAIIVHNAPQSEALSPLETCQIVPNTSFIGDPDDCQGWYYCLNGEPLAGKCKSGLLFNSFTGSCDYANNVVCGGGNTSTLCTGLNGVYKRDPNSCQGYCYCSNGETGCANCPNGQVFDLGSTSCVYPSSDVVCSSGSPCLLANNGFIKNPDSCAGWYRCYNGQIADANDCSTGLYFDASTGSCNYESIVGCNVVTTAAPSVTSTLNPDDIGTDCASAVNGFIADPDSCNGYYYCLKDSSGTYISTHWGQCPKGSQFNPVTGACTNSYNIYPYCAKNRCQGVSYNYVTDPASNCKSYFVCNNEVQSATSASCANTNFPYFNEKAQGCQKDLPDLPICPAPSSG